MSNPREEEAYVAGRISELIVDKGYRYNDIAVITGDMDGYYRYIEEEFSKNNIPAFIDHKHNIASNPFVDGIKAAIEIVEKDFSYETVFHLIRLGFLPIDREAADVMENYVLQSGILFHKKNPFQQSQLPPLFRQQKDLKQYYACGQ